MSLIADALKRAQEQRKTGRGEDRARRMLSGSGPLRVETRDRPPMTRPLAVAVAALVLAAGLFAGAILMTPTAAPAAHESVAAGSVEPRGGPSPDGASRAAAAGVRDGGEEGGATPDGGTVAEVALAQGVLGGEPSDGVPPREPSPVEPEAESAGGRSARPGSARGGVAAGPEPAESPMEAPSAGVEATSSFRITVRGSERERTVGQYFEEALGAHRAGDLERAASLYRAALELRPGDAELWNNLGTVYRGLSRGEEALAAFRSAVEAEPSYAPAWSNLGLLLDGLGRSRDAIEAFREALRQDPDNVGAKVNLANTYQALGMGDEARALLREVLRADPSLPEAHYGLARALEEGGALAEAARHYRLFLELGRGRFPALEARVVEHLAGLPGGGS